MKRLLNLLCGLLALVVASPVYSLTFSVYDRIAEGTQINNWISTQGNQVIVLEDFEELSAGWYESTPTGVGTFTAGGSYGSGATSYNSNAGSSTSPYFSIQNRNNAWYGRENITPGGSQWIDSGDITLLTLTGIDSSLTNLFFYLQDASDVSAITTIGTDVSALEYSFDGETNGTSYFVGITIGDGESLSEISWSTSRINDGYGLDDFSTVTPVPEPATMLLFSIGLLGLAGVGRKKLK